MDQFIKALTAVGFILTAGKIRVATSQDKVKTTFYAFRDKSGQYSLIIRNDAIPHIKSHELRHNVSKSIFNRIAIRPGFMQIVPNPEDLPLQFTPQFTKLDTSTHRFCCLGSTRNNQFALVFMRHMLGESPFAYTDGIGGLNSRRNSKEWIIDVAKLLQEEGLKDQPSTFQTACLNLDDFIREGGPGRILEHIGDVAAPSRGRKKPKQIEDSQPKEGRR